METNEGERDPAHMHWKRVHADSGILKVELTMNSLRTSRMRNPQTNSPQMKRVQLTLMPGIIKHSFS